MMKSFLSGVAAVSLLAAPTLVFADDLSERLGASFSNCDRLIASAELLSEIVREATAKGLGVSANDQRVVAEGIVAVSEQCPIEWHERDVFSRPHALFHAGVFD